MGTEVTLFTEVLSAACWAGFDIEDANLISTRNARHILDTISGS